MTTEYYLYSDASLDPKSKIGITATLILTSENWQLEKPNPHFKIDTHSVTGESISRLEFISAIRVLKDWKAHYPTHLPHPKLTLIIDCKAIENLILRRERLENQDYISKKTSRVLNNADLYKAFLLLYSELRPEILWVKGHAAKSQRTKHQELFSLVDRKARKTLRESTRTNPSTETIV